MASLDSLRFDNRFARLPAGLFSRVTPTGFERPFVVAFNPEVATLIGLDPEAGHHPDLAQYFGGRKLLPGSDPLAMKYTGHQFGVYNPDLGDGRGLLLGEVVNERGETWDLHLKGAGQTPYSRFGDGRAVLRSCIREYLGSEAMHHLGIPSTRALCIIGSDEPVQREKREAGAMLLRVADTHIRFGHLEWLYHSGQHALLAVLVDFIIAHHYPDCAGAADRHATFFREVVRRTARLMAQWQLAGFAHGVMNTDNFSISGATFDYGPFGFLDAYEPGFICNHSDYHGRYAWNQQPSVGLWNLNALAHALSGLVERDALVDALQGYQHEFLATYSRGLHDKLGLRGEREGDQALAVDFLELLAANGADYTRSFRALSGVRLAEERSALRDEFVDREAFDAWHARYRQRLLAEDSDDAGRRRRMDAVNPKYILRNYLAQVAIDKAEAGDYSEIETLRRLLMRPYDEQPQHERYAALPPDWGRHLEISCSS
ncbi:MAG TPA: YdiU family protein [Moraxellaceae bacterium]|nr:YdiU family protein [Moraxellaceae bacterium]